MFRIYFVGLGILIFVHTLMLRKYLNESIYIVKANRKIFQQTGKKGPLPVFYADF